MIDVHVAWDRACRPVSGSQKRLLAVRIRPGGGARRNGVRLVLLLDVSGSMHGARLQHAKDAVVACYEQLTPGDALTVITFGSRVREVVTGLERGRDDLEVLLQALRGVRAGGTTLMGEALLHGLASAGRHSPAHPRLVWVISDGDPTDTRGFPLEEVQPILDAVASGTRSGIDLGVLALGPRALFRTSVLQDLAAVGGGWYGHAEDPAQLAEMLAGQLSEVQAGMATDGELELTLGTGSHLLRVGGVGGVRADLVPHEEAPRRWRVPLGELRTPEATVLLELVHAPPIGTAPGDHPIGEVGVAATVSGLPCRAGAIPLTLRHALLGSAGLEARDAEVAGMAVALGWAS